MNLRVRSPAIAGRADPAAGLERVCRRPSQRRPSLPTVVQEAELGAFPPLFLALLARGGFFSPVTPLLHPLLPAAASRRLCKLCAPPARAANSASGPGPAAAPLHWGAGRAWGRACPRHPRTRLSPPRQERQTAGEGAGRPPRGSGRGLPDALVPVRRPLTRLELWPRLLTCPPPSRAGEWAPVELSSPFLP